MHDMKSEIRAARTSDASDMIEIISAVFPDSPTSVERAAAVLKSSHHATHVATRAGRVIGFVNGFATPGVAGAVWTVDLLAVLPEAQGSGMGKRLLQRAVAAQRHKTPGARALVRVENHASQCTFAACGFAAEAAVSTLLVRTIASPPQRITLFPPHAVALLPVTTITYDGVWIEPNDTTPFTTPAALQVEHHNASLVIPKAHKRYRHSAETAGFTPVGSYQWWTRCDS